MKRQAYTTVLPVVLVVAVSATGCSLVVGESRSAEAQSRISRVTRSDIYEKIPRYLRDHRFYVQRHRRTSERIYFRTEWKTVPIFEAERAGGAVGAQSRLILRAERTARWYTLHLTVERRVRSSPGVPWTEAPETEAFERYAEGLHRSLEARVSAGVRTY